MASFWTTGFNQHYRGSWVNEQAYMVHLLLGKQARPGDGGFSLTGQPSACGTARETGTFAHRLPADLVVTNPKHRARSEDLWKLPAKTLNPKVGSHITKIMRDLEDGSVKFAWVQVSNPFQATANANHWIDAAREMGYSDDDNLYDVLFATPTNKRFAWPDPVAEGHHNSTVKALGEKWFPEKALFEEYAAFGRGHQHDLADFDLYFRHDVRGLRWPSSRPRAATGHRAATRSFHSSMRRCSSTRSLST